MSAPTSDRFRRLERPRTADPDEPARSNGTGTRIEAVEGPAPGVAPPAGAPASGGELGRFRAPPERGLELDTGSDEQQPFQRCAACETDNFRTAATCTTCGAELDTEPQRQFNQRFWAGRRAEAAVEAEASAAREAVLEQARLEDATQRRQAAETMARAVGEAERQRLEREGLGGGWSGTGAEDWIGGAGRPAVPLVFRLLRGLPAGWPLPVGLALLALPFILYLVSPLVGLVSGAVLVVLCLPSRRRTWLDSWLER